MARHLEVIRSRANPALRRVAAVRARKHPGLVLLEGERLVLAAREAGLTLELLLLSEERAGLAGELAPDAAEVRVVAAPLMDRVSALDGAPGVLALCRAPVSARLEALPVGSRTLFLVVAGVSDPGNLGALARSAEALGASAALVAEGGAGPFNPKALRGSMGSLLRLPLVHGLSAAELAQGLHGRGVRQVIAATRGGADPREFDWSGALALWVGSETGDEPEVCAGFERVTIPMAGGAESLNVTVAASLLLFAAGRAGAGGESK